jgi:hypothetical protein
MKRCRPFCIAAVSGLVLSTSLFALGVSAQDEFKPAPQPQPTATGSAQDIQAAATRRQEPEPISPERRRELRQFVRENSPELERMLTALFERNPQQFHRALASVNDSYRRLQAIKKSGNEALYAQALENWKLDVNIKLVGVQMTVRNKPGLEKRLKRLVAKQIDSRIESMKNEKIRLQNRLATMEASLVKLESERDSEIERRVNMMMLNSEKVRAQMEASKAGTTPNGAPARPKRPSRIQSDPADPTGINQKKNE